MKPQQAIPLLSTVAPAALAVSPLAIVGVLVGAGLLWLLAKEAAAEASPAPPESAPEQAVPLAEEFSESTAAADDDASEPAPPFPNPPAKRINRENLAEALEYGARLLPRKAAVESLQALGFRKTVAYKALSPSGKFGSLIETTPDGLIGWKG